MFQEGSDDEYYDEDLRYHENFARNTQYLFNKGNRTVCKKAEYLTRANISSGKGNAGQSARKAEQPSSSHKHPQYTQAAPPSAPEQDSFLHSRPDFLLLVMQKIEEYVRTESEPDARLVDLMLSEAHYSAAYSKENEAGAAQRYVKWLGKVVHTILSHVQQCKVLYTQQIKRLKESAQASLQQALQLERANALQKLSQYEASTSAKHLQELNELQRQCAEERKLVGELRGRNSELLSALQVLEGKLASVEKDKDREWADKLVRRCEEMEREKEREIGRLEEQGRGLRESQQHFVEQVERGKREQVEEIKREEKEKREAVEREKREAMEEVKRVREEMNKMQIQQLEMQEKYRKQLQEREDQYQLALSHQLAEAQLAKQTGKEEQEKHIASLERDLLKLRREHDEQVKSLREDLYRRQAGEMEAMRERLQGEQRRRVVEIETHFTEQMQKMKALHEQEMQRHIRENERLRRVVAHSEGTGKGTMGGDLRPLSIAHTSSGSNTMKVQFTPRGRQTSPQSHSFAPPPPPPRDPPNTLLLDEAVENAKRPTNGNNIATNTRRVSSYLRELEKYITEGNNSANPNVSSPDSLAERRGESSDQSQGEGLDNTLQSIHKAFLSSSSLSNSNKPFMKEEVGGDGNEEDSLSNNEDFLFHLSPTSPAR